MNKIDVTKHLVVVDGDIFFSEMQTLTIPVNIMGAMGKGLALQTKKSFPDVYAHYQSICKKRILRRGKPYLYKRETLVDAQLTELQNVATWFLLFPTKNHWKERSDIVAIEKGLIWLLNNYRSLGIASLAVPALGCGLGQLEWNDVGPLLCKYLSQMIIPVEIYLPTEKQIPNEYLLKEFLLKQIA